MANPWNAFPALQRASEVLARRRLGKSDVAASEKVDARLCAPSFPAHSLSTAVATARPAAVEPHATDGCIGALRDHLSAGTEPLPTASFPVRLPPPPPPQLTYKAAKADAAIATDDLSLSGSLHRVEARNGPDPALSAPVAAPELSVTRHEAAQANAAPAAASAAASASAPAAPRLYPGGISKFNYWHTDLFPRGLPLRMARPQAALQRLHAKAGHRECGSGADRRKHGVHSVGYVSSSDDGSDDDDDAGADSLWYATAQPAALSFAERVRRKAAAEALQRKAANAAIARAVVSSGVSHAHAHAHAHVEADALAASVL